MFSARLGHGQATNLDFELGVQKYHQSDWDGAITNFSKSIESGYNLYDSYSYRAYSLAMKGSSNAAIADGNRVVKWNPSYSGGYYWRSHVKLALTNFDGALTDFEAGLKLYSRDRPEDLASDISNELGRRARMCMQTDDIPGAISNVNAQVFLYPTNSNLYSYRAQLKLFQGQYDAAITDAGMALKYNSNHYFAFVVRAWARLALNDVKGSNEDQGKASAFIKEQMAKRKMDPRLWQTDKILDDVLLYLTKGETQEASKKLNDLIEVSKAGVFDTKTYQEHWQKLIEAMIAKAIEKKN